MELQVLVVPLDKLDTQELLEHLEALGQLVPLDRQDQLDLRDLRVQLVCQEHRDPLDKLDLKVSKDLEDSLVQPVRLDSPVLRVK